MSVNYEDIKKANDAIEPMGIKDKDYAPVNQRIKAFRMVYPEGFIKTNIVGLCDGVVTMRTEVGYYAEDGREVVLGTGYAQEKENSSFINKTSFIENCETSSCGRALGMCGFGIEVSVASAEEVQNAINNQDTAEHKEEYLQKEKPQEVKKATPKQVEYLLKYYKDADLERLLKANNLEKIEDISMAKASELISKLKGGQKNG